MPKMTESEVIEQLKMLASEWPIGSPVERAIVEAATAVEDLQPGVTIDLTNWELEFLHSVVAERIKAYNSRYRRILNLRDKLEALRTEKEG